MRCSYAIRTAVKSEQWYKIGRPAAKNSLSSQFYDHSIDSKHERGYTHPLDTIVGCELSHGNMAEPV
jgi:hypothetical protein